MWRLSVLASLSLPDEGPVDGGAGDGEELRQITDRVLAGVVHLPQLFLLFVRELGSLALQLPLGAMPSRVRRRIKSASNSAKVARMLKNIFPIGSAGSYTLVPSASFTPRATSSSAICRASGTERANRSNLGTTSVSPARTAASARSRPGRARGVPVRPRSI